MTLVQKFIKKNSVEALSAFFGAGAFLTIYLVLVMQRAPKTRRCLLSDLFFGAGHALACLFFGAAPPQRFIFWCWSCSVHQNGVYSGHLYTQRIYKNFDDGCWEAKLRGVQSCGGGWEGARVRGTMEAGAFGQRGSHGHIEYIYTPPHTTPPTPLSLCSKDAPIHANAPKNFTQ